MSTANLEIEIGSELKFASYYMECGEIQRAPGKDGLIVKMAKVNKIVNGILFYTIAGETGERKCKLSLINEFRDFGTSIYGLFTDISDKDILLGIVRKLNERIFATQIIRDEILSSNTLLEN